jgi:hypothetical protein
MPVLLGAFIRSKYDYLDYFHQSILNQFKEEIKKYDKNWLRLANQNLRDYYNNHKEKATLTEKLFNEAKRELIRKELNSRKKSNKL